MGMDWLGERGFDWENWDEKENLSYNLSVQI